MAEPGTTLHTVYKINDFVQDVRQQMDSAKACQMAADARNSSGFAEQIRDNGGYFICGCE